MSCSFQHCVAITSQGFAYSWGSNRKHQLGLNMQEKYIHVPQRIMGGLETNKIVMSCCGEKFTALLTYQGEVWTFGTSESGVLGHEEQNTYTIKEPRMINDIPAMCYIACSNNMMFSIVNGSCDLYAWGNNMKGQLGIQIIRKQQQYDNPEQKKDTGGGEEEMGKKKTQNIYIFQPRLVIIRSKVKGGLQLVAAGTNHALILMEDLTIWSTGLKQYSGQYDPSDTEKDNQKDWYEDSFSPIPSLQGQKFEFFSCGENHSLAFKGNGELYGWGNCENFKLFTNDKLEFKKFLKSVRAKIPPDAELEVIMHPPQRLDWKPALEEKQPNQMGQIDQNKNFSRGATIKYISCGLDHNLLIDSDNHVYSWGSITSGKLGLQKFYLKENYKEKSAVNKAEKVTVLFENADNEDDNFADNKSMQSRKSKLIKKDSISEKKSGSIHNSKSQKNINYMTNDKKKVTKDGQEEDEEDVEEEEQIDLIEDSVYQSNTETQPESVEQEEEEEENEDSQDQQDEFKPNDISQGDKGLDAKLEQSFQANPDELQTIVMESDDKIKQETLERLRAQIYEGVHLASSLLERANMLSSQIRMIQTYDQKMFEHVFIQKKGKESERRAEIEKKKLDAEELVSKLQKAQVYQGIPFFIMRNIQLYENIVSLLYYHPCYLMRMVQSGLISIFQLEQMISVIFGNPFNCASSETTLTSMSIKMFQIQYKYHESISIENPRSLSQNSLFWFFYITLVSKQTEVRDFFKDLALLIVNEFTMKVSEQLDDNNLGSAEKSLKMNLALDYTHGTPEEIRQKLALIEELVKKIIKLSYEKITQKLKDDQLFISSELFFIHNSIIGFVKQDKIEKERQDQIKLNNKFTVETAQKIDDYLKEYDTKLQVKLNNFLIVLFINIFNHFLFNYDEYSIPVEDKDLPYLAKKSNLRIIIQAVEQFIFNEPYKSNSSVFQHINKFIRDRGVEIKETEYMEKKIQQKQQNIINKQLAASKKDQLNDSQDLLNSSKISRKSAQDSIMTKDQSFKDDRNSQDPDLKNMEKLLNMIGQFLHRETDYELGIMYISDLIFEMIDPEPKSFTLDIEDIFIIHNYFCDFKEKGREDQKIQNRHGQQVSFWPYVRDDEVLQNPNLSIKIIY